ncbi:MAG: diguanylate cyclase [Ktedonobacteraceae bacterium]|nr:diguanylate cyclase [Ktedonobacteraceae bacterium]
MSIFHRPASRIPLRRMNAGYRAFTFLRPKTNPLLNIPIARRLAIGFLIPALIASIALGSISLQSMQLLSKEATFYNNLVQTYTSLTTASSYLQAMDTRLHDTLTEAVQLHLPRETLQENQSYIQHLTSNYNTIIQYYRYHALLEQHPDLEALFSGVGDGTLLVRQRQLAQGALQAWRDYFSAQTLVLHAITTGDLNGAQAQEYGIGEPYHATAVSTLGSLIQFNAGLVNTIHNATQTQVNQLLLTMVLAILGVILGIAFVGWLVSSTLVRRLRQLGRVVQSIEEGQMDARLVIAGRDEIATTSGHVNTMLDTIVGLLEKTREQRDALIKAEALAIIDPLTGLVNHRGVMQRIDEELARCQQTRGSCAILFIDIDRFKHINDTWGHQAGDAILRETAQRLTHCIHQEDCVGRYGGEEFAVVLKNTASYQVHAIAERLRVALAERPCLWQAEDAPFATPIIVTASIGASIYQLHGITRATLIEAADNAMYHVKHTGRNRVCIAGEQYPSTQNISTAAIV